LSLRIPPGLARAGLSVVPVWHAQQATLPERRIALTPSAARRRHPPSRSDLRWPLMVRQVRCGLRTLVNAVENSIREAGLADGVPARHRNLAGEQDPWEPRCLLLAFRALTGFRRRPSNQRMSRGRPPPWVNSYPPRALLRLLRGSHSAARAGPLC